MACNITITDVSGVGGAPASILVTGTLGDDPADCPADIDGSRVVVEVSCISEDGPFSTGTATHFSDGTWEAAIPSPRECQCGGAVFVRAFCASERTCQDTMQVEAMNCPECPDFGFEPGDAPVIGPCRPDGTRDVAVKIGLTNNTNSAFIVWFEPGHPGAVLAPGSAPQTVGLTPTQNFEYQVTFRYPTPLSVQPFIRLTDFDGNPAGCESFVYNGLSLERCRTCPDVEDLTVQIDGCAGDGNVATATFTTAVVPPESGCLFAWNFGDSSPLEPTIVPTASHQYDTPGDYSVSLAVSCNGCLMATGTTVTIPKCDEKEDEPVNPFCGVLTYAIGVALGLATILTLLVLALQQCTNVPVPAALWYLVGAAWAVVAILIALSYFLCKFIGSCPCLGKCDWLAIAWIGLMIGGIFAIYLAGCCGAWMTGIAIGMLVLAFGALAMWIVECKPSRCLAIALLLLVFATIAGTTFSYTQISALKVFFDCANDWVRLAAATIAAALTLLNLICLMKEEADDNSIAQP